MAKFVSILVSAFTLILASVCFAGGEEKIPSQESTQPLTPVQQSLKDLELDYTQTTCPICLEDFRHEDQVAKLGCDADHPHPEAIHFTCLSRSVSVKASCPLCRKSLSRNQIVSYKLNDPNKTAIRPAERETRTTSTGAVYSFMSDLNLGTESWEDPTGLVWGDIVKDQDGNVSWMTQEQAFQYCLNLNTNPVDKDNIVQALRENRRPQYGYFLPRIEDFEELKKSMMRQTGSQTGRRTSYSAQILPSLDQGWFWSSSIISDGIDSSLNFDGKDGSIYEHLIDTELNLRCVLAY